MEREMAEVTDLELFPSVSVLNFSASDEIFCHLELRFLKFC